MRDGAAPPTRGLELEAARRRGACWSWKTKPALAAAVADALRTRASWWIARGTAKRRSRASRERPYDLVICDLKMPRLDGMAFYRAIAATTPALARRVIFVTGDVAGTDAERFLEESGCRWLAKPFRLGDLLRAARDVLA